MDANAILRAELAQRHVDRVDDLDDDSIVALSAQYAVWLPIDTFVRAPWLAPYAVRKIRIRTDPNAPGPKRDLWGLPDSAGFFTDDNSLLKGVVLRSRVSPSGSPYGTGTIRRGLVCCHVWPATTADPLLFSFVPNLVWLPADLAKYSDAHTIATPHQVHEVLKDAAIHRFGTATPLVALERVNEVWRRLDRPSSSIRFSIDNEFVVGDRVVSLVHKRISRLTALLDAVTDEPPRDHARFSKRYHGGTGVLIDKSVPAVQEFVDRESLVRLRDEMSKCLPAL